MVIGMRMVRTTQHINIQCVNKSVQSKVCVDYAIKEFRPGNT